MLSPELYRIVAGYDYALIYQTDAYIFQDGLKHWMDAGYDYIGAPWVNWIHASKRAKNSNWINRLFWAFGKRRFDAVGNGGFSLRKISTLQQQLTQCEKQVESYQHNEDFFLSFELQRIGMPIKIPPVKVALNFAFDENPETAFAMAGNQLPMGCHGWPKYYEFWKKFITY